MFTLSQRRIRLIDLFASLLYLHSYNNNLRVTSSLLPLLGTVFFFNPHMIRLGRACSHPLIILTLHYYIYVHHIIWLVILLPLRRTYAAAAAAAAADTIDVYDTGKQ